MGGIRVNTGIKKIEVNDDGEYILLNFGDQNFRDKFVNLSNQLQIRLEKSAVEEERIKAQNADNESKLTVELITLQSNFCKAFAADVDDLLGEGTCRKVFGDIVPALELFYDFFYQLMPYLEEYSREQSVKVNKYNANRTGNV